MGEVELKLGLTINLIAGGMAILVVLALPLAYFVIKYEQESTIVQARAAMYAGLLQSELPLRRDTRPAQDATILAGVRRIIGLSLNYTGEESRRLIDDDGSGTFIQTGKSPEGPLITRSVNVTASALPIARMEVSHSMQPFLIDTGLVAVISMVLGYGVFILFRTYPLHALRLAEQELKMRQEMEAKLQKSVSVLGATLESTADGILVLDDMGRLATYNDRFLELWLDPEEKANASGDSFLILAAIGRRVVNAEAFLDRFRQCRRGAVPAEDWMVESEIIELRDERAFEVTWKPQRIEGMNRGWVLSFHDVSERRRIEALLTREKQVLEMIIEGEELEAILGYLARYLEKQAKQMFCTILVPDEQGVLRRVAGTNLPKNFIDAMAQAASLPTLSDSWSRQPAAVVEVKANADWAAYNRLAAEQRLQPWWAAPIRSSSGAMLGAVVAHYRTGVDPDPYDAKPLELTADLTRIVLERKQSESRLEYLAHYDDLTGLPNRILFHDRLLHAMIRAERNNEMLGLMFLDLDRFKTINDTLGHVVGDQLLKEMASRLQGCVRENDSVARFGGDEFILLLEGILAPEDAGIVAHKIIDTLKAPFQLEDSEVFVSPSIGISIYPLDGTDPDDLLKYTDKAMYSAKEVGGNNYQFYTQAMNAQTDGRLALETELRHALARNEFAIYYQPKVSLTTGAMEGMEALIRWNHPQHGVLPPSQFIPLLEDTGLINPVGEWLLHTACAQIRQWRDRGLAPLRVAVNISGRQFLHNDLVAHVSQALGASGLEPDCLELEVTESMLMHDPEHTAEVLRQIRALGVLRIGIDDFGTGYSSLGYLKRFPISTVKIDASFVRDIPDDKEDVAIVMAVIAMSHSLGLKVVAEGVENLQQMEFLRERGCDEIQGYFVSPPLPAAEFEHWLLAAGQPFSRVA